MFKNESKILKEKTFHDFFLVGIIIKGIDGILQVISGVILFFVSSGTLLSLIQALFRHEILQDPADLVANFVIHGFQGIPVNSLYFIATYFVIHGSIKITLSTSLLYQKKWAYPVAGIALSISVLYQLTRFFGTHSLILLFLTLIDILIIIFLKSEYYKRYPAIKNQ